jgi:hypothetical protein
MPGLPARTVMDQKALGVAPIATTMRLTHRTASRKKALLNN